MILYPEQSSHLLLMDTVAAFNYPEEILANAWGETSSEEVLYAFDAPLPETGDGFIEMSYTILPIYFHSHEPELVKRVFHRIHFSASSRKSNDVIVPTNNVIPRLGQLQRPTLIMVGREDYICPPSKAEIMHNGIPNLEIGIFENSGHLPHMEEPEKFFRFIKDCHNRVD